MEKEFWLERWETNNISFHEGEPNSLLVKQFSELDLPKGKRVFLPLCGKTRDIAWLLAQGYPVAGAELSADAVKQLFAEMGIEPEIETVGALHRYFAEGIDIFAGDIFELTGEILGKVEAIYDRAALVALPLELRRKYTAHLRAITDGAPQLLITFDYDQLQLPGPPFSIGKSEVGEHYNEHYQVRLLEGVDVEGGLKGVCAAIENIWLLSRK